MGEALSNSLGLYVFGLRLISDVERALYDEAIRTNNKC